MIQLVSKVQNLIFSYLSLDSHCNKRTYIRKLKILHRLDIYISTKYGNSLWCSVSLHLNCHHKIISTKFNLNIFYLPPYERNIITNFVPNDTITSDDRDPSWMNSLIKNLICANDNFYKKIVQKSNNIYHLCIF